MVRILHVSPSLPPDGKGGQNKCILKILQYFQKKYKLDVLLPKGKNRNDYYCLYEFDSNFSIKNNVIFYKKLKFLLKQADIVHYHFPINLIPRIMDIPIFLILNFFFKKKYIIHIHLKTYPYERTPLAKIFLLLIKIFFNQASLILTPTHYTRYDLYKNLHMDYHKIRIVPYGVSSLFFSLNSQKTEKSIKKIIYIGRLHYFKHVNYLIKAIQDLPENYYLEIYGDGEDRKRLENIAQNSLKIKFFGFFEKEKDISSAFSDADLMVLPSKMEEMPLSIMESLAARVPVLCSNLPSVKSFYQKNIYYVSNIEKDLKKRIWEVINSNNNQMIKKGRDFVSRFTWEQHFKKIDNNYYEILKI